MKIMTKKTNKSKNGKSIAKKAKRAPKIHPLKQWFIDHPQVTQREFAERIGISQPHLSQASNRKTFLSAEVAAKVSKRTKIPVAALVRPVSS